MLQEALESTSSDDQTAESFESSTSCMCSTVLGLSKRTQFFIIRSYVSASSTHKKHRVENLWIFVFVSLVVSIPSSASSHG